MLRRGCLMRGDGGVTCAICMGRGGAARGGVFGRVKWHQGIGRRITAKEQHDCVSQGHVG